MFDGSKLPYEENAAITKRIVEMAHVVGVPVEAELGQVPTAGNITWEDVEALMTDPEEAKRFVEETGVDFLAVAVGSVHKMTAQAAKIDVERTKKIAELTGVPLVLHGASGVTDDGYKEGIKAGICKINIATELNKAFTKGMHDALAKKPDEIDPRRIVGVGRQYVKEAVKAKMRLFGCSGKA